MTWRQTLQRRRIHSADLQTLELRYLGLFESIQNLRRESGVVVEVDDCLLVFLRKKKTEAAAKFRCSRWGGISIVAWRRDGGGRGVAPDFIGCGELRVRLFAGGYGSLKPQWTSHHTWNNEPTSRAGTRHPFL